MLTVTERSGTIDTLELEDRAAGSLAVLAPSRGGMLTRLAVRGRELLYLDPKTFEDRGANVRGGNPVLFPSPGKLAGDTWERHGARGSMKQHGFARNLPWDVASTSTEAAASVTLRLRSSDVMRAQYPWDFVAEYTYALSGSMLSIAMRFTNTSPTPMPFGAGFHPYFAVADADKSRVSIATRATRAFDNATKQDIAFEGFDFGKPEIDLHLYDHGSTESSLTAGDAAPIVLRGSPEFTHWVVWALKGRDFICVEPWTCPGNALNTGERLLVLGPGETRSLGLSIGC